jgi:hypothetical protein
MTPSQFLGYGAAQDYPPVTAIRKERMKKRRTKINFDRKVHHDRETNN